MKSIKTPLLALCGLSLAALPAFAKSDAEEKFKMMDANSDEMVSLAEHTAGSQMMFAKLDTNRDGNVTAAEMEAAWAMKSDKKRDAKELSAADKIREVDANGDGQLTQAEHDAGAQAMFTKADKNSDGSLSEDEFEDAHKAMKKEKKKW